MRRHWRQSNALPEALVQRAVLATSRCEHAWRTQRPANDWAGLLPNLREVLAIAREEAEALSQQAGLPRYDALMDRFEPGMTTAKVDAVFGDVRRWLPGLIQQVIDKQSRETVVPPKGPFPVAAQRAVVRTRDRPARVRFQRRPARRQHAPVLRRRARRRAHDHALSPTTSSSAR